MAEFVPWGKTPRYKGVLEVIITEKIDGTNSCVVIDAEGNVTAQSRNRIIYPDDDNFGFAAWVQANEEELLKLGEGYHFGEWAGPGIQKNPHKLPEKTFFLFNTFRPEETLPSCVKQVPTLYKGQLDSDVLKQVMDSLAFTAMQEGYTPEGIIIYYFETKTRMKYTFNGNEHKGV